MYMTHTVLVNHDVYFWSTSLTECECADLVEEVPDVVQVLVEVDVPQSSRRLAGVLQPLLHALIQVLLLQPLQHT